jgi:polyketide biosynthesis acyl carrier protein
MHVLKPSRSSEQGTVTPRASLVRSLRLWASIDPARRAISVRDSGGGDVTTVSYAALDQYSDSVAAALRELFPEDGLIVLDRLNETNALYVLLGAMKARRRVTLGAGDTLRPAPLLIIGEDGRGAAPGAETGAADKRVAIEDLLLRLDHPEPEKTEAQGIAFHYAGGVDPSRTLLPGIGHADLTRWLTATGARHGAAFGARSFFAAPITEGIGLFHGLLMPIYHGGEAVRLATPDAYGSDEAIARALVESGPVIAGASANRMWHIISALAGDRRERLIGTLRTLLLSGAEDGMLDRLGFEGKVLCEAADLPMCHDAGHDGADRTTEADGPGAVALDRVWSVVRSVIVEILGTVETASINAATRLVDLGANSIDRTEIVVESMGLLGLRVPQTRFAGARNVGEMVTILSEHIQRDTGRHAAG